MARHRVSASCAQRTATSQTPPSSILLPPKSHLREPPVSYCLRPELSRSTGAGLDRCISGFVDDTEISIFDAKRYFSEGHDAKRCDLYRRDSSSSSVDGYPRHGLSFSFSSTPTASSEASWNSQPGLLANPSGSVAVSVSALPLKDPSKSPPSVGRRPPSVAGSSAVRNCLCYGKKSVDVEEKCLGPVSPVRSGSDWNTFRGEELDLSSITKRTTPEEMKNELGVVEMIKVKISSGNGGFFSSSNRFSPEVGRRMVNSGSSFGDSGGFSFPILNHSTLNFSEKPARKSLEVFRPANGMASSLSTPPELRRRTTAFPFSNEVDRKSFSFPLPVVSKPPPDDDVASDASSDLFEIETFSSQTTHFRRISLDKIRRDLYAEAPPTASIAPSECYAPSEVSIDWSVITSEGFDRASLANSSSAASDFGELRFLQAEGEGDRFAAATGGGRRRRSGLLSCRSQKAVSVGPNPVRLRSDHVRSGMNRALRAR